MKQPYCEPACEPFDTVFCPRCGRADKPALGRVRLMGAVGVKHTSNEKVQEFLATGSPAVFARPEDRHKVR